MADLGYAFDLKSINLAFSIGGGERQMYPCNEMEGILLPWGALGFSTEQLN